jgi:cytochrome c-type biogenesis protein CcmH
MMRTKSSRFPFILLLLFLVLIFFPTTALAQESTPSDDDVNEIASQLYCPVCENTPLDVCPTKACQDWRAQIKSMLAEGSTPAEIKQYFVDYYGARVLSEPPAKGINWLVYIVPPAAFILGTILLLIAFRTWRHSGGKDADTSQSSAGVADTSDDDQYVTRIENELKNRK